MKKSCIFAHKNEPMFKYQELIDLLPVAEINSAIREMVKYFDLTGKYYSIDHYLGEEKVFNNFFSQSQDFREIIKKTAQKEYDEDELKDYTIFSTPETDLKKKKDCIFRSLLDYVALEAKKIVENREDLRIPIGNSVDFKQCIYAYKYLSKIEFYKDGGWGIAEENGTVLVRNHLMKQPSYTNHIIPNSNCPYCIIQDRDTKKYGVLSKETFHEIIHCHYDKIEVIESFEGNKKQFYLKVLKNNKWGCYDKNCALLVECKYDEIIIKYGLIECIRDGYYLNYDNIIEGKKDLYDNEGILQLGGYDHLVVRGDYLLFYFGTTYDDFDEQDSDFCDLQFQISRQRLNYQNSKCLVLDRNLKTILKNKNGNLKLPKGTVFSSLEEVKSKVPSEFLLNYRVDLSDLKEGFIYLHDFYGEYYFIPHYILWELNTPEELGEELRRQYELDKLLAPSFCTDLPKEIQLYNFNDKYIEDSFVTVIKISENKEINWVGYVNEVITINNTTHIFRKGQKYGFFDADGFNPAIYDAVTKETPDGNIYVAKLEICKDPIMQALGSPNYSQRTNKYIHYYSLDKNGNINRVIDSRGGFDPTECKWYPSDFIENYYDISGELMGCYHDNEGYEWTDEDAWDAMTDGMYGDYPGSGWDPEMFGF